MTVVVCMAPLILAKKSFRVRRKYRNRPAADFFLSIRGRVCTGMCGACTGNCQPSGLQIFAFPYMYGEDLLVLWIISIRLWNGKCRLKRGLVAAYVLDLVPGNAQ